MDNKYEVLFITKLRLLLENFWKYAVKGGDSNFTIFLEQYNPECFLLYFMHSCESSIPKLHHDFPHKHPPPSEGRLPLIGLIHFFPPDPWLITNWNALSV